VATATSINNVAITAPAASATLTIADGKTLTVSNTLTFSGTDSSSVAFGTGGTVAYVANKLSVFAATTSAELAGVISDETGSGALVFASAPALTSPVVSGSVVNSSAVSPTAFSASSDNLAIGDVFHVRVTTDNLGAQNLTGMTGGAQGRTVYISNIGATDNIVIKHDATSTEANRFYGPNSADVTLRPNGSVLAVYDGTSSRWRVMGA
jgi:hypothetical protein